MELSGRHTAISMMKEHSIDEITIKKIVGHSGAMTLTERVYTHLDVRVLIDAINKIVGERENGKENLTT
ncbi:integrase [Blautia massiliensis (ex Durand et al. 2017)]|uniref:integrase n=1 Tax=Blautia massiliensis (ex Durand et al. 2017) TaxID=1737424 RepID=UPI0022E841D2|nr:integrase [Blautia massiliensis (ex Durand et al. 2017)]